MTNKDDGSSFVIGFVVGAIAGLAIGFLYSPRPGKETRELLKAKTEEMKEKAVEVTEKVKETAAEVKKKAQAKMEAAKE